jgi:hypothetical protein
MLVVRCGNAIFKTLISCALPNHAVHIAVVAGRAMFPAPFVAGRAMYPVPVVAGWARSSTFGLLFAHS